MPELPEMENYKLLLTEKIQGRKITKVQINREKSINVTSDQFINIVQNQKIDRIERKAKHLLIYLDNDMVLLLHLMLGGLMYYGTEADKLDRTVQIQLSFGEDHLYFIGLRLGYLYVYSKEDVGYDYTISDLGGKGYEKSPSERCDSNSDITCCCLRYFDRGRKGQCRRKC